jgi:hypothetical protein
MEGPKVINEEEIDEVRGYGRGWKGEEEKERGGRDLANNNPSPTLKPLASPLLVSNRRVKLLGLDIVCQI